jgi:hypothetical protein
MGITDTFFKANSHLKAELGYHLDPEHSDDFRGLLKLVGYKRFDNAVAITRLRALGILDAGKRHKILTGVMWELKPEKRGKYRSSATAQGKKINAEIDNQMLTAMALDG